MAATQSTESLKQSQGGRHRIFTAEQRKDRNRLAQAAFRERRNQYTSTLEKTVIELETIIRELQESNRNTSERAEQAEQHCAQLTTESLALRQLLAAVVTENQRLLASTNASSSLSSLSSDTASVDPLTSPASSTFSASVATASPSPTLSPSPAGIHNCFPTPSDDTAILYQALFPQLPLSTGFSLDTFVDNDGQVKAYLG